jgi:hypothetical protein
MGDRLFSLRGLEPGEKHLVSMLLVQALFLGIFIGAFDISAHSMFLAIYDEKILAKGYIVSGFAGIFLLFLNFFFQSRIKSRYFELLNLTFVAAITLILWIFLSLSQSGPVVFMVFVFLGPLNILAVMDFRATARKIFDRVKGKRLNSTVDSALIIGIIISCFAIPVLMSLKFLLHNVLLISLFSIIISAVVQHIAIGELQVSSGNIDNHPEGFRSNISVLNIFREDRYSRLMGIFIIISVVSALFIQYSFLAVTRERFPAGEDMATFLGIFTAGIMIFTLAGKLMLFSYLLSNYGLRICLTISPILLAIFTSIAIVLAMAMGYTMETAGGFMIFFILLALMRFLSKSMDDTIESPSFRLLYQTIDEKLRVGVQSVMDNAVKEAGAFLAGLILAGIGVLSFIKLIHFSWILIIVLFTWMFVAYRLYIEYKKSIRKGLESLTSQVIPPADFVKSNIYRSRFYGERVFRLDYFNLISGDLSLFEKTDNKFYFKKIIDQAIHRQDVGFVPLIRKMAGQHSDGEIRQQAADILKNLEGLSTGHKKEDERIISAKRVLSATRMPQTTEILRLLRDKSVESKRLAIYLIGKFRLTDMLPEVCECLNFPGLEIDTMEVLKAFGSSAEEELIRYYLVSSGNINTSKTIMRLLARLPLDDGTGFLFSRLWSNSRQLKEVALRCLIECRYTPSEEDKERLNILISDIIGIITWNLSAKRCLEKNNDAILLNEVNKELDRWSSFLIDLLSITYNAAAVTRIRKNLEFETIESVHYSHAIIDIIVDDSIKAKIIYLLDVIPDDEKLENLKRFFPVEIPDYYKLLEDILNRDYNLLGLWTKACVLRYLPEIRDNEMAESVIALLFSPENILQEEAVRLIARSDLKLYRSVYNRIPVLTRKRLDKIIDPQADTREFLFEKILFLTGCFSGIFEDELLSLAKSISFSSDLKTFKAFSRDGYILWTLMKGSDTSSVRFCYSSGAEDNTLKHKASDNSAFYILPFKAVEEFLYQFPDNADAVFNYFEENER